MRYDKKRRRNKKTRRKSQNKHDHRSESGRIPEGVKARSVKQQDYHQEIILVYTVNKI